MCHEKVLIDGSGNPIHNALGEMLIFDRGKLYDVKDRNKRLGCPHSGVNLNFELILEPLETDVPQCMTQILEYKNKFKTVVIKIYALDYKGGNL
jgi:hypothetical protein